MITKPVVVLFSGGLDSLSALIFAREIYGPENVLALYCDVGQRYANKEISAVEDICKMLKQNYVIERRLFLGDLELPPEQNAIIPYRNSVFILLAAIHTPPEGGTVIIENIVVGETSTWDRRLEFNIKMQELLKVADPRRIELKIPHANKTKSEVVTYLKHHTSEKIILRTIGCYSEGDKNCGECNSCFRAFIAMVNADIPNPERRFSKNPVEWTEGIQRYVTRMLSGKYEQVRVDETFRALSILGILKDYIKETYAIDLDGTLTDTGPEKFTKDMSPEEVRDVYYKAVPIKKNINIVNNLYDSGNVIIIHTSRYEEDRGLTINWLKENNVKYHHLVLGKPRADHYVDDKNMSIQEFTHRG